MTQLTYPHLTIWTSHSLRRHHRHADGDNEHGEQAKAHDAQDDEGGHGEYLAGEGIEGLDADGLEDERDAQGKGDEREVPVAVDVDRVDEGAVGKDEGEGAHGVDHPCWGGR